MGEFNATDPDAYATLTYHLVSGAGDTDNSPLPSRLMVPSAPPPLLITRPMPRPMRFGWKPETNTMPPWKETFTVQLVNNPSDDLDFRGRDISSLNLSNQDLSSAQFDNTTIFSDGVNGVNLSNTLGTGET